MYCKLFVAEFVVIKCSQNRLNSSVRSELSLLCDYEVDKTLRFDCLFHCTLFVFIHPDCRNSGCNITKLPYHVVCCMLCCIIIICSSDIENGMLCNHVLSFSLQEPPRRNWNKVRIVTRGSLTSRVTTEQRLFDKTSITSPTPSQLLPQVWSLTKHNAMVTWLDNNDNRAVQWWSLYNYYITAIQAEAHIEPLNCKPQTWDLNWQSSVQVMNCEDY